MNSKGLSESMHVIILFMIAFLVILILFVIVGGGTKNAGTAIGGTDPSTGFDSQKEDFCNKACAKDITGNCGGATTFYEGTITCRQHLDSIEKRLEVTYTPSELSKIIPALTLTITVKDFQSKTLITDATVSVTSYSGPKITAAGIATFTFLPADISITGGVGHIEGTVKLTGYPDATFSVLVRG